MLILTRQVGEKIIIDKNIHITVLATKGTQLRLGIEAPAEVEIHREEIFNRIYGISDEEISKENQDTNQINNKK